MSQADKTFEKVERQNMKPEPRDYETRIWYSAEAGDECYIA
jgi:hypothetical protein